MPLSPLAKLIILLLRYKYGMVIIAAVIEGPMVGILCGFLLRLGYFHFWPIYLTLISADLVGDALWYTVGYYGASRVVARWGHFLSLDKLAMEKIEAKFKQHQNKTLLISKMTSGFGFAIVTLVTAGVVRIPLKNYAAMNALGGFVWSGVLLLTGYFFGNLYSQIDAGFRIASLVIFAALVFAVLYGFQRFMRNRLSTKNS